MYNAESHDGNGNGRNDSAENFPHPTLLLLMITQFDGSGRPAMAAMLERKNSHTNTQFGLKTSFSKGELGTSLTLQQHRCALCPTSVLHLSADIVSRFHTTSISPKGGFPYSTSSSPRALQV